VSYLEQKTVEELAVSLENNPRAWQWRDGDFSLLCGPGGIRMSAVYFTIYAPVIVRFGFWGRRRIGHAVRQWKRTTGKDLANDERNRAFRALRRCLTEPLRAAA
jgi:hypothetical protein